MADSIPEQESCICVCTHHRVHLIKMPIQDHFFIDAHVSVEAVFDFPPDPFFRFSRIINGASNKLLQYTRQAFLSRTDAEHREIITNMIQSLEINTVQLENIQWSVIQNFQTKLQAETVDEITARLVDAARYHVREDGSEGHMRIIIRKVLNFFPGDFRELCSQRRKRKREWRLENEGNKTLRKSWCRRVMEKLTMVLCASD